MFAVVSALASGLEVVCSRRFWSGFDETVRSVSTDMVDQDLLSLDELPSRGEVLVLGVAVGAARGLGFAILRPILPRQPEAAAVVYSSVGAAAGLAGIANVDRIFIHKRPDPRRLPHWTALVQSWVPRVLRRAATTAVLDRLVARRFLK